MTSMRVAMFTVLGAALGACTPPGEDEETSTTSGPDSTSDITASTLPTLSGSGSDEGSATAVASTGPSDGGSTDDGATTTTTTGPDDTTSSTEGEGSSDTNTSGYEVEWCILQYPPMVTVAVDEAFTVYVRFFVSGLTDQTTGNDPDPDLVVEMGYGLDGSNPSTGMGAPWTFVPAGPNPGWDDAVSPNNDEYQGDIAIDTPGIYDYAARISGDGGRSWVYCDLDDLLTGGYTPDQAGHAEVGQM